MSAPTLWERLRRARIVQVLVVYLGASWAVLQLADVLTGTAGLPEWVGAFTLLLLVVGLVVTLATAWVQSLPSTTAAEVAGERPTDWEIAPADALASLKSGKLPHLTWGRAILGGVMALSLLFGGAGVYVLVTGGRGFIGPAEVGAGEVAGGIAVLPFNVRGDALELYREGMVDLLSTTLDGVGGYRTIDSRTVLARWNEEVGGNANPDLDTSLRAAGRTGARYALLGSLVPVGPEVRLAVEVYDLDNGNEVGSAQVSGATDDILSLVDAVTVGITRELLGSGAEHLASAQRIASITTSSLPALEDYLEGERLIRRGDFEGAIPPLRRAVAEDSTFALAWGRLAEAIGWSGAGDAVEQSTRAEDAANRHSDRLSPREATLTQARAYFKHNDPRAAEVLHDFLRRYPDEADAWYTLAESYFHLRGIVVSASRDSILTWFTRAAVLDPGYAPYIIHIVDLEASMGRLTEAREWAARYGALGARSVLNEAWDYSIDIYSPDPDVRRAAVEGIRGRPSGGLFSSAGTAIFVSDFPGRELPAVRILAERDPQARAALPLGLWRAGRWHESQEVLASAPAGEEATTALVTGFWHQTYGLGDLATVHRRTRGLPCGTPPCPEVTAGELRHGGHEGYAAEATAVLARLEREVSTIRARGDSAATAAAEATLRDARAFASVQTGDPASALAALRSGIGKGPVDFLTLAVAADEAGDVETAERYLVDQSTNFFGPYATYRLAKLYERTGRTAEALAQYKRLALMWEDADADFPPLLEVKAAVERLGG